MIFVIPNIKRTFNGSVVKAEKPYGHTAYTRTTKTGKLVAVGAKGVKPVDNDATDSLGKTTINEHGRLFETGKPVSFTYHHETQHAPKPKAGAPDRFQQRVEPAGRYVSAVPDGAAPTTTGMVGSISFNNPLVVYENTGTGPGIYDDQSWKMNLSRAYSGKKGKALSAAIAKDGYDGIVTVGKYGTGEIVDLRYLHTGVVEKTVVPSLLKSTPDDDFTLTVMTVPGRVRSIGIGRFGAKQVLFDNGQIGTLKPKLFSTEIGPISPSWLARLLVFSEPYSSELDATISLTAMPAPMLLHNIRKGRSVTPAIGATMRLFVSL